MRRTAENEFPYLRAWSKLMAAYPYSVEPPLLETARKEKASQLVIYKARVLDTSTMTWVPSPVWVEINPDAPPETFSDRVLRYVEEHYQLSYSQVKAWNTEAMSKDKTARNEYPYVKMWGKLMGSYSYYITAQVEQAKADNAPQTAIYKRKPPTGQDWSDRPQSGWWAVIQPGLQSNEFKRLVLERVQEEYGLTYEDVEGWDNEQA